MFVNSIDIVYSFTTTIWKIIKNYFFTYTLHSPLHVLGLNHKHVQILTIFH